jgi:hypothetical protein
MVTEIVASTSCRMMLMCSIASHLAAGKSISRFSLTRGLNAYLLAWLSSPPKAKYLISIVIETAGQAGL